MIVREFSLGRVLSIADCCLGLMLIRFSSVAVAIIAAMPTRSTKIGKMSVLTGRYCSITACASVAPGWSNRMRVLLSSARRPPPAR